jgi:hypothetical protein
MIHRRHIHLFGKNWESRVARVLDNYIDWHSKMETDPAAVRAVGALET